MSSCPGCLLTGKDLQRQYETTYTSAVKYGEDNQTDVAIYKDIDGYSFIEMSSEIIGKYQIKEVVTYKKS